MTKTNANQNSSPPSVAAVIGVLRNRLKELGARREYLLNVIIHAEHTANGQFGDSRNGAIHRIAQAMVDGADFSSPPVNIETPLQALRTELNTIDAAIKIGNARLTELSLQRAAEAYSEHFPEIAALEKRRILLAFELQGVNRQRERLREKMRKAGGPEWLATDGYDLLGLGHPGDEISWSANRALADGIMTAREVAEARNA